MHRCMSLRCSGTSYLCMTELILESGLGNEVEVREAKRALVETVQQTKTRHHHGHHHSCPFILIIILKGIPGWVPLAALPPWILMSKPDMISKEHLPTDYDCSSSSLECHLTPYCSHFSVLGEPCMRKTLPPCSCSPLPVSCE